MKNIVVFFTSLLLLYSCSDIDDETKIFTEFKYQNHIILSDLSDRIEPYINTNIPNQQYPPKDIEEINEILERFKNESVRPGQKIGDRSSISFSTFSMGVIARIDIEEIKNLTDKQQFVNSTGKYQDNGLDYEISKFKDAVKDTYTNFQDKGLDLISVLIDFIENGSIIKNDHILAYDKDSTFINYDNHIYIFTDGYLEYYGKSRNKQFYFGDSEIKKIRQYCRKNNVDINTALKEDSSLCLTPVFSKKNQFIDLHILETHERDKNFKLTKWVNELGERDNEILEAVWRKWAMESGFKSFEWRKY